MVLVGTQVAVRVGLVGRLELVLGLVEQVADLVVDGARRRGGRCLRGSARRRPGRGLRRGTTGVVRTLASEAERLLERGADADLAAVGDQHVAQDRERGGRRRVERGVDRLDIHQLVADRDGQQVAVGDLAAALLELRQLVGDLAARAHGVRDLAGALLLQVEHVDDPHLAVGRGGGVGVDRDVRREVAPLEGDERRGHRPHRRGARRDLRRGASSSAGTRPGGWVTNIR